MGTPGTDPYREIFLVYREKFEKSEFFRIKKNKFKKINVLILRNSLWGGSFPVGRELPDEKGTSQWKESFLAGRELPGGERASRWEGSFPVRRELHGGKRASQ